MLICKETEPQTFVSLTLLWVTDCDFLKILLRMKLPPPVGISVPRNHSFTTGLHRKKEPGKPADRKSATNEQSGWETDSRAHHRKAGRQTAWGGRLQRERTAGMFSYHTSVHGTSTPLTAALPCAQSSQTAVLAVWPISVVDVVPRQRYSRRKEQPATRRVTEHCYWIALWSRISFGAVVGTCYDCIICSLCLACTCLNLVSH